VQINQPVKERVMNKFKAVSIIFAVLLMAGCASTDVAEDDGAAARADQQRRAAQQAEADKKRSAKEASASARKRQKALEDAAENAGNVVYFDFDKSTLTVASRGKLDAHIALLKTNKDKVRLEGHTDERGTREYNMALGERRAKAVADYMSANGVSSRRTDSVSYGEERPVAMGRGESNWSKNRRVELK
jgi:peptidoglycan-associated lipoprotein